MHYSFLKSLSWDFLPWNLYWMLRGHCAQCVGMNQDSMLLTSGTCYPWANNKFITHCTINMHTPETVTVLLTAVPPTIWIQNKLIGAQDGQKMTLECHSEAYPKSSNYWTTDKGEVITKGKIYWQSWVLKT
jgi:late competence protein required for DNA uptake (superfamily II DNA/RNA helicase)